MVLADLAEAVAALPQVARQLGDILEHADNRSLRMDSMTGIDDPGRAIAAARRHLEAVSGPALYLYRLLDAAHQETAHVALAPRTADQPAPRTQNSSSRARRPEERQPPAIRSDGPGLGPPR